MRIGVLAVQGAFVEHEAMFHQLGAEVFEIRQKRDLDRPFDGLVLPGGESTVMKKLLRELDLLEPLRRKIEDGMPVLATCAGLILLAEQLTDGEPPCFATLPVTVRRNAYGRQLGSFSQEADVQGIGSFPMVFIRAPYVETIQNGVEVLATVQEKIVAVCYQNQIGLAFHPELSGRPDLHRFFLKRVEQYQKQA
ncbi:pyridoxal 5'-phosphate synthase glutaminase subunit PdxT [Anaeromassilibacillus senegalensis]|uniref:pyridoxal 5'-phosphate synthase glutaminase subunit PdxT n=1 Tax=Anaeromassilibacillus senegalensis TaxID=1673717 RepID=UPI00068079D4|nr:pyridoxal 5'-phosphate synthase glutaminase subunit PdxT [Anaeromassilibacillus senegalensis]